MNNMLIGEFFGSMTLAIFGCGVVANATLIHSKGNQANWMVIATGWCLAVILGVFVAQATGSINADINPAITLSKWCLGNYTPVQALSNMLAQVLGCFCGAIVVWLAYWPHWEATNDTITKRNVFCTSPAIRHLPANFLNEFIGTFVLVFILMAIFSHDRSHQLQALAPYIAGILVWAIGLSLGGPTGYAINPARDLGPRLAHALLPIKNKGPSDFAYSFIPVIAPLIGGTLGGMTWKIVFNT